MQPAPAGHSVPHVPQSSGSAITSTHAPLQSVSPLPQAAVHTPALQTCPAAHACPHEPQLAGSLAVSEQAPLHRVPPS
jgi:hypothetical protein